MRSPFEDTGAETRQKRESWPDFFRVASALHKAVIDFLATDSGEIKDGDPPTERVVRDNVPLHEATGVGSALGVSGYHMPVLDIDMDAVLLQSTTPGHHHLIINTSMDWPDYLKLLDALVDAGIVQAGYRDAAKNRGESWIRTPWTVKEVKEK